MSAPLVINATAIGRGADGIGVYGIRLLEALAVAPGRPRIVVVLNRDAATRVTAIAQAPELTLRWIGAAVSPDRGPRGHLLRWLAAQVVAARYPRSLVFGLSQIEVVAGGGGRAVMVHDTIPVAFPQHHPRQRHFWRHVLGRVLQRQAVIAAPSETTKRRLRHFFGLPDARVQVIPHGSPVPVVPGPPSDARREPFVLWIGRAGPMKNLETLVCAFRMLRPRRPHALVVAGSGDREALPQGRRSDRFLHLLGPVSDRHKVDLLDRAALLVCPSLDEGFGLPVLEAMSRGCPVVASNRGSLPEVCAHAALYADPTDAVHLATQMRRALDDRALRGHLVARGLERARDFSWTASAHAHLALFERALTSPAAPPARTPAAVPTARAARVLR